jgi:predicted enzyme related to lactoylglutathione lyase
MKILQTISRIYLQPQQLTSSTALYESLLGVKAHLHFKYEQIGLELTQIGSLLLIAGSDEALQPFRATVATFLVDSLEEYHQFLLTHGATIVSGPKHVPTGMNMTAIHPDGTHIEYVQHDHEKISQSNLLHHLT